MLRTAFVAAVAGSAAAFAPAGPVSLPRVLAPATGLAARLSAAAAPASVIPSSEPANVEPVEVDADGAAHRQVFIRRS